jgi:hypothetical protein
MSLTAFERETAIWTNDDDDSATISTFRQKDKNKLLKLKEKYPDQVTLKDETTLGNITGSFPKSWVRISAPQKISEERKQNARERMTLYRSKTQV